MSRFRDFRGRGWSGVAALALGLSFAGGRAEAKPKRESPNRAAWQENYDKARAQARRTGKPLLLVFR